MKNKVTKVIAVAALAAMVSASSVLAADEAASAEVTLGLDVASAYVFRGATFNDGFVAQPSIEVSGLPITFGVWGNFDIDDYDGAVEGTQFSEVDLWASYALDIDGVDASIGYTEYLYPSGGGDADREIGINVGLDLPLAPTLGVYYGLDGAIEDSLYADLSVGHDLELSEDSVIELGALVGYMSPDVGEDGFSHYEVSAGIGLPMDLSLTLAYIDTIDDDVLGAAHDTSFVGTISKAMSF